MTAHVHSKNFEESVVVLQNVSLIEPIKFFLLLHILKKVILIRFQFTYQNCRIHDFLFL